MEKMIKMNVGKMRRIEIGEDKGNEKIEDWLMKRKKERILIVRKVK